LIAMSIESQLPASAVRLYKSTTIKASKDGRQGTACWAVDLQDLDDFLTVVGGMPETVTFPGGLSATRLVPLLWPDPPYKIPMYAYDVDADYTGYDKDNLTYSKAKVKVAFKTYSYDQDQNPFFTEQYDGASDFITLPGSAFQFPSDGRIINTEVGLPIPTLDFSLTFYKVPSRALGLWTSLQGYVNSTVFLPNHYGLAPGTVLYMGPSENIQTSLGGVVSYQITHKFRWRYIPHNMILRPDSGGWEAPVRLFDGAPIMPTADLNALFV